MNKYLLSIASLCILYLSAEAQSFHRIDSLIESEIRNNNIFGGVALIAQKNKVLYHKAYGSRSIDASAVMQKNDIFRIASQTKAIVSVAILQLVEKGFIHLDDPISLYFPAFEHQKVYQNEGNRFIEVDRVRPVTIRDLLSHQSGISSVDEYPLFKNEFSKYGLSNFSFNQYRSLAEEVDQIAKMPLMHQPGARFSYGLSTNVLGALIELVSGLPLDSYLKQHIFKPLKMHDTYFYLPTSKQHRLVSVAFKSNNQLLNALDTNSIVQFPKLKRQTYFSAIGGLVSTTYDYFLFLNSLLTTSTGLKQSKQSKILQKATIDSLLTNQLGDKTFVFGGFPSKNQFGLGVGLTTEKGQSVNLASVGSFFWGGAFNTAYMVDPKRALITLFFFQRTPFVLPPLLSKLEKTTIEIIDNGK